MERVESGGKIWYIAEKIQSPIKQHDMAGTRRSRKSRTSWMLTFLSQIFWQWNSGLSVAFWVASLMFNDLGSLSLAGVCWSILSFVMAFWWSLLNRLAVKMPQSQPVLRGYVCVCCHSLVFRACRFVFSSFSCFVYLYNSGFISSIFVFFAPVNVACTDALRLLRWGRVVVFGISPVVDSRSLTFTSVASFKSE